MTIRILLTVALVVLCGESTTYAEWVRIASSSSGKSTVYADPDTHRRKGTIVKWWELWDNKDLVNKGGVSYLSSKIQAEYDCGEERVRMLAFLDYSGNMGNGEIVRSNFYDTKWEPIVPGSNGQATWNAACLKK